MSEKLERAVRWQKAWREFVESDIGKLFTRYETATIALWRLDTQAEYDERFGVGLERRLREAQTNLNEARMAFLAAIGFVVPK